ncbi:3-hydroxyisobutyrate dehydrogenase [Microvirga massiliensis]|uniref:3-hydroxyisobutyrate dehydrogenase n=1 Tax=Microvirga massiliensis TaxID=1033741 RepID=UPI00062B65DB|nr:3-hydroxyisobutyrate dehydrogenase [Microvirga massiliensis]
MARIGFVGLGNMGGPMAANLVKAGHEVVGYDLNPEAAQMVKGSSVRIVDDVRSVAEGANAVVSMLPSGPLVLEVWAAVLPVLPAGSLIIDSSTIDVASARRAHEMAGSFGVLSLDAPVSGGTEGAQAGTLTFMAGGTEEAFATAKPLLAAMGRRIIHCGDQGAGQIAKLCNNMILGISMIGVSEAFLLAERLGLDRQALFDVASTSSGQCYALTTHCPVPGPVPTSAANRDYTPGFAASLMAKDLRLAQESARACGCNTPLGMAAAELYQSFERQGGHAKDYAAIIRFLDTRDTRAAAGASVAS